MNRGRRGPSSPAKRHRWAFRPTSEGLEDRRLLATIDLTQTQVKPYGVENIGPVSGSNAGFTVTDVGNVDGSGYDSYVIGGPALAATTSGAAGLNSVYLVLGSHVVGSTVPFDFRSLTPPGTLMQRAGDLGTLGATAQVNPTVTQPTTTPTTTILGFNYDGITFRTSSNSASNLGFKVAALGDINNDSYSDFAISAPQDTGGGRVFIVYGGPALSALNHPTTVDLEPTSGTINPTTPTKTISIGLPGQGTAAVPTDLGASVAGIGNFFNDTTGGIERDVAIGAPGYNGNTGEVFAIPASYLNTNPSGNNTIPNYNIDLNAFGRNDGVSGIIYRGFNGASGTTPGGRLGASVASAGNFDNNNPGSNNPQRSLLIGEPNRGNVYLVYSIQTFPAVNSVKGAALSLSTLGNVATTAVPNPLDGVVYQDPNTGDRFGATLTTAGDFNGDGPEDIAVGAPGANTLDGAVAIIYGSTGTATSTPTRLNGTFSFDPTTGYLASGGTTLPAGAKSTELIGTPGSAGLVGSALAPSAHLTIAGSAATATATKVDLLIGAPGITTAYLVPGNTTTPILDPVTKKPPVLSTINAAPLNGTTFTATAANSATNDPLVVPGGFGTSVSARNPVIDPNSLAITLDNDAIPDFFFGAPFTNLRNPANTKVTSRTNAGIVYAVEGSLIGGASSNSNTTTTSTSIAAVFNPIAASLLAPPVFTGLNAGLPYPPVSSLEHLTSYAPLPVPIAYEQFLPAPGFRAREAVYHNPKGGDPHQAPRGTYLNVAAIGHSADRSLRVHTLPTKVFTRDPFKHGQTKTFTHKVKVIPRSQQTEKLTSA